MAKDYAAIAARRIHRVTEHERAPRILVYGRNKKGKTRFCATAPGVLILDPEGGTKYETKLNPDVWPVSEWSDIEEAYGAVKSGIKSKKTGKPYEWVALDGMTKMLSMAIGFVSKQQGERDLARMPNQTDQRTYGMANKMVEGVLTNFHSLRNVGLIMTAQERMETIENMEDLGDDEDATPAGYMYVPDLTKGARAPLNQVVDVIGRIYVVRGEFTRKVRVRGGDGKVVAKEVPVKAERRLWIGPHEMYDTGFRSEWDLPDFITNPSVPGMVRLIKEGK